MKQYYHEEVYNGYTISLYKDMDDCIIYKIAEEYLPGKWKVRRESACNLPSLSKKGFHRRDEYGNKLYTPFDNNQQAIEKAKNYIDNHIVRWVDSPHYKPKTTNYEKNI